MRIITQISVNILYYTQQLISTTARNYFYNKKTFIRMYPHMLLGGSNYVVDCIVCCITISLGSVRRHAFKPFPGTHEACKITSKEVIRMQLTICKHNGAISQSFPGGCKRSDILWRGKVGFVASRTLFSSMSSVL